MGWDTMTDPPSPSEFHTVHIVCCRPLARIKSLSPEGVDVERLER